MTGSIIISGSAVTHATFRIALVGIKVGGKTERQLASNLDTRRFPIATFTLAHPVQLGPAFVSGVTISITAIGELAMNGVAQEVHAAITSRRDGLALQAAGSIPVPFAEWGIKRPGRIRLLRLARRPRHGGVLPHPAQAVTPRAGHELPVKDGKCTDGACRGSTTWPPSRTAVALGRGDTGAWRRAGSDVPSASFSDLSPMATFEALPADGREMR